MAMFTVYWYTNRTLWTLSLGCTCKVWKVIGLELNTRSRLCMEGDYLSYPPTLMNSCGGSDSDFIAAKHFIALITSITEMALKEISFRVAQYMLNR